MTCLFGLAPSTLNVLPENKVITDLPMANIMDSKPMLNILPFGMCQSISNPMVAAATAAALGVLTPMPCMPEIFAPWSPGNPTVLIGGNPVLTDSSHVFCRWGGLISIDAPGQSTITD